MAALIGAEEALKWSAPYWEPYVAAGLGAAAGWASNKWRGYSGGGKRKVITAPNARLPPYKRPRNRNKRPPVIVGPGNARRPKNPTIPPFPPYVPVPSQPQRRRGRKTFRGKYRYVGSFKRPRRRRAGMFAKHGVALRVEAAGNVSQDKCIYVGHSTGATTQLLKIMSQAIVRKLCRKVGYNPTSMDDLVEESFTNPPVAVGFRMTGDESGQDSSLYFATGILSSSTWSDVAAALASQMVTRIDTSMTSVRVMEFIIYRYNDSATPIIVDKAVMNANKMRITLRVESSLRIQNRTRAHTEVGAETSAAAQSSSNVENNPIMGKCYWINGSSFRLKNSYDASNTFGLTGNANTGVVGTDDIDTSGLSAQQQSILSRPPSRHSFIGVSKEARVILQPGEIKGSWVSYKNTLSLNSLIRALLRRYDDATPVKFWPSVSKLFAFEKMMHTDDAEEPDIDIGYECNTVYKASVMEKRQLFGMQQAVA